MQTFRDYNGNEIILTDADREHIAIGHNEIVTLGLERVIGETLESPEVVIARRDSAQYYHWYTNTEYGDKYVCIVVRQQNGERYIRTAYVTSRIRRGRVLWQRER